MGIVRGLITLVLLVAFLALVAWLASGRNKHRFDAVARLPLEEDSAAAAPAATSSLVRKESAKNQLRLKSTNDE